ncbi:hypothetical protein Ahy_B05g076054 [Arachis hypogaea]|uniref:DUF223 domain-containing protein n=1 Tax=Arachis hypogaea TaxID=3818 RepID=A0A444Z2I1_ARAHY|nr:hypothetical protein Ahy_B05g076054 [Arachis hypogaea]
MEENFDLVTDVNPKKIWEVLSKYNEKEIRSIEMILQDVKGGKIHCTIPWGLVKKWRGAILEFQMYTMANFIVFDYKYKEKNGVSRMVLTFSQRTLVNHVKKPSFPLDAFCLKSYVNLLTVDKLSDSEMFDLIGEVVGKEDPRDLITSKGKETKQLVIILQDLETLSLVVLYILRNNRINCILFGELVDHLLLHLEEERAEPLIVVLQYFKATRWNGKISVQRNFKISKVHINPELTEVIQFKSKLSSPAVSNSTRISQVKVSSPNAWSALDELKHGSVAIKTIEEALNFMEEGPIWILGTIVSINAGKDDWFYKFYRRCPKKVETPLEIDMNVASADTHTEHRLLEVTVCDGTGSMSLLLWDRETIQLCEKSADKIICENGVGEDYYPQLQDNIMDKRVLFKLNVKSGNIKQYDLVYTVIKNFDDEDIIMKNMLESLPNKLAANEDGLSILMTSL